MPGGDRARGVLAGETGKRDASQASSAAAENGDADQDLAGGGSARFAAVLRNGGGRVFATVAESTTGQRPLCVALADRNAISKERGLLQEWTEEGPPLAWRIEGLGGGYSAPSVAKGRLFGMSSRGEDEVVGALSETDGKEIWATRLGPALTEGMPQGSEGPGCTPTVDGDRLYVLGLSGVLACLEARDGAIVWRKSLTDDFGGRLPTWRYNESPLVDGGKVICTPGGDDATPGGPRRIER